MSEEPLLERLDPVLEHRVRLAVCVLLSRSGEINFSRFKKLLKQTDGNLGAQLRKLEDEAYIALRREFAGRRPITWYRLAPLGKKALKRHVAALESILGAGGP